MYFWNVKRFPLPQMPSEEGSGASRHSAHGKKRAGDLPQRTPHGRSRAHRLFWLPALVKHQVSGPTSWTPELSPCQGQQALKAAACLFFFFLPNCWSSPRNCRSEPKCNIKSDKKHSLLSEDTFFFSFLLFLSFSRVFMSKGAGQTCCFAETSFI